VIFNLVAVQFMRLFAASYCCYLLCVLSALALVLAPALALAMYI